MVLLSLIYSRRRGKRTKWDGLLILFVLSVSVSMSLVACGGTQQEPTSHTVTITQAANGKTIVVALDGTDIGSVRTPAGTPSNSINIVCWMTFTPSTTTMLAAYGIKLEAEDDWTPERINAIYEAVQKIGYRLSSHLGGTNIGAYNKAIGPVTFVWCYAGGGGNSAASCRWFEENKGMSKGGRYDYAKGKYAIYFWTVSENYNHIVKNVIHELGHVIDSRLGGADLPAFDRTKILLDGNYDWQQHPCKDYPEDCNGDRELFGDMFLAWVYTSWNANPDNIRLVADAIDWMNKFIK
jgi:hypothetical protein